MFPLNVVQVGLEIDRDRRAPVTLLAAWPTLTGVAEAVARAGVCATVVVASHVNVRLVQNEVTYRFVRAPRWAMLGRRGRQYASIGVLAAAIGEAAADVVHIHGLAFPLQTRGLCAAVPGTPVLVQDHASHPPRGVRRWVHRWGFRKIAAAAFTARDQARPFFKRGVFRPSLPVFEVVEGSTDFAPGDQRAARTATGLDGDPCLLWLGRLTANKDPLTVLDGFRRAARLLPDLHLWCCYLSGELREQVEETVRRDAVLARRVHLLGARSHRDVEMLLRAADFLVQGSHVEGSGYAVIEALACGTTPIATDIPSFRRLSGDGAVAGLWPPGDAQAMARTLTEWSRRDRRALRARARQHFERELSYDAIGSQLRTMYEAVASGP